MGTEGLPPPIASHAFFGQLQPYQKSSLLSAIDPRPPLGIHKTSELGHSHHSLTDI